MATDFPGAIDALTNPTSSDTLDNPSHSDQHADANDAIEAIETALGANMTNLPLGILGYASVTASQGSLTASEADLTGLSVTITALANRRIRIVGHVQFFADAVSHRAGLYIKENTTYLLKTDVHLPIANGGASLIGQVIVTPSAGSHTYKLAAQRTTGGGTVTMFSASDRPAFILVEDIGPA